MLDEERCRRILSESFPELDVRTVRYFAQGWDYELWEVACVADGELLCGFPLRPECAGPLRIEARLLVELAEALSVRVPRPLYVSDGCVAFPQPFFGYRKLAGRALASATDAQRLAFAPQIGRFLSELHSFPSERAAELGVPRYTPEAWREHYRAFRETTRRDVEPLLASEERDVVEAFWRRFLDDERHFRFEPALVHADLGQEHLLVSDDATSVTAAIDFGDALVGDPAIDFVAFDPELRGAVLESYEPAIDETFLLRAGYYLQIGPMHEVLYGLRIEDPAYVESGLAGVRRRIVDGE